MNTYPVLSELLHDGVFYPAGPESVVEMSAEAAAPLIAIDVLGEAIPEPEQPAEKIPSTEEGGESEGLPLDPPPTNSEPGETEPVAVPEEVTQVNVNTATQAELEALPHIGKTAAQRLITGRPYADLEQVRKVLSSLKKEQWQQVSELIAI